MPHPGVHALERDIKSGTEPGMALFREGARVDAEIKWRPSSRDFRWRRREDWRGSSRKGSDAELSRCLVPASGILVETKA